MNCTCADWSGHDMLSISPSVNRTQHRPQVGDIWEGTGTNKYRIRVKGHDQTIARVLLIWSQKETSLTIETIQKHYRLVERERPRKDHYP